MQFIIMEDFDGVVGIDLGTTYSCVAFWDKDKVQVIPNSTGKNTTPSYVSFGKEIVCGDMAKKTASKNPANTLFGVKRLMGKRYSDDDVQEDLETYPYMVTGDQNDVPTIHVTYGETTRKLKPEQVSALVLEEMKRTAENYIGKKVKKAVITVPAYFNDSQRGATKNAAKIAGLECMKILNEPTAACMCYGLDKKESDTKVLIFDLGGGTFDVSILNLDEGIFEVLSTSGNTHLGGEDFDNIIVKYCMQEFQKKYGDFNPSPKKLSKLKAEAEEAKRTLSSIKETTITVDSFDGDNDLEIKFTRRKFEMLCDDLFRKCLLPVEAALNDSKLDRSEINDIVLVGGSTRIPKIQELLMNYFNGASLNKSVNPDEAVAYGAAVQGAILSGNDESGKTDELLLLDVTPLSIGIKAKDDVMSVIIPRNTQTPTRETKYYTTSSDGQTSVNIEIFEGERQFVTDNHKVGDFLLKGLPSLPRGAVKVEVTLTIDCNGILTVTATDCESGTCAEIKVTDTVRLSQDDINRMIDEADEFRADDELRRESLAAKHAFEKDLDFTMSSMNNPELNTDESGKDILTEKEKDFMNQFILNNLTWLEDNDGELSKEQITQAKDQFKLASKEIMSKIYARKKQLDMKRKYVKEEHIDEEKILQEAFSNM